MNRFIPYNVPDLEGKRTLVNLILSLAGTITPWILGTLLVLMSLALAIVIKSWREVKSSPYYFMRRQAEKRLQTYSFASLCLVIVTAVIAIFTLQEPVDQKPLGAIITNSKPATEEVVTLVELAPTLELIADVSSISQTASENNDILLQTVLTLPEQFNEFEPTAELNESTDLSPLIFSTKIDDDYQAVNPTDVFEVGQYTVFATFAYEGMADGMEWAWVWRHEGEVVDGGNELWAYGDDGPGYIYFGPEEGFRAGDYSLEVWVNGELFTRADMTMTGSALSVGN